MRFTPKLHYIGKILGTPGCSYSHVEYTTNSTIYTISIPRYFKANYDIIFTVFLKYLHNIHMIFFAHWHVLTIF